MQIIKFFRRRLEGKNFFKLPYDVIISIEINRSSCKIDAITIKTATKNAFLID